MLLCIYQTAFKFSLSLLLFCFVSTATGQRTIQVPADNPTVQGAIDVAVSGDTVNIAPGVYGGNIDFKGKNITVQGSAQASSLTREELGQ